MKKARIFIITTLVGVAIVGSMAAKSRLNAGSGNLFRCSGAQCILDPTLTTAITGQEYTGDPKQVFTGSGAGTCSATQKCNNLNPGPQIYVIQN